MKKLAFPSLVLTLLITLGFVYRNYTVKKDYVMPLKERRASVHAGAEWLNTKQAIEGLLDKIRRHPDDVKAKIQLALAYVQEGRVTGDHAYYDEAALALVNDALAKDPQNFDGLCARTTILLSQHHFTEGLAEAQKLVSLYPDAAFGYGLLVDANVELGQYEAAVKAADRMVSIRPDLRSYSRISYLREIHGDFEGAKQAMTLAVNSGSIGLEQTEWCRVQLGKLCEKTGDTATARKHYLMSLAARDGYPHALAGLARLSADTEGPALLEKAIKSVPDPGFYEDLADVYCLQNKRAKADETASIAVKLLGGAHDANPNHAHDASMPAHGHYADKELAEAYLKLNDWEHALFHANLEYTRRPDNIDINEVVAWVHYKIGAFDKAAFFAEKALRTSSKKPELLWKAGQIFLKNNQEKRGNALISEAFKVNKNLKINCL